MTAAILSCLLIYTAVVLFRPHWGIYTILALLPAYQIRFDVFGLPTTLLEWLILILAVVVLTRWLVRFPLNWPVSVAGLRKIRWLLFFILLFFLASLVSVFVSPVPVKALGIFKAYVFEGVLFWLLCLMLINSPKKLSYCFWALGLSVIALSLFGIFQYFTLYRLPPSWWGPGIEPRRVVSLYTYPNAVALLIAPILALFTALLIFRKKTEPTGKIIPSSPPPGGEEGGGEGVFIISKPFIITVLSLGLILLVLTFSRGGWIGYALSVLFLTLFSQYRKFILTALVIGILAILLIPTSRNRLLSAFTGTDPAGQERIKLWQTTADIIKDQPILGAGLMGFREWYGALRPNNNDEILNYPHNFFLNFWTETGLFGLLAVLGMLIWTFWQGIRLLRRDPSARPIILAVLAAWIALLGHGMLDAPFFKNDLSILFWFLLAIIPTLTLLKTPQEAR